MAFKKLYKKRGFHESLFVLYKAKNYSLSLPIFFERLTEFGSYYNAFFRVKNEMVDFGVIEYKKSRNKERMIGLTPKGIKIVQILKQIEDLLSLDYDEYLLKKKRLKKSKSKAQKAKSMSNVDDN